MNSVKKGLPLFFTVVMLMCYDPSMAQDVYAITNNGDWNTNGTWSNSPGGGSCGCTPGNNDNVHIGESGTITVTISTNDTAGSLTVYNGGTLQYLGDARVTINNGGFLDVQTGGTVDGNGQTDPRLRIRGNLSIAGTGSIIDITDLFFTADATISGNGSINCPTCELRLNNADVDITNNNTGTITVNILRLNADNQSFTNNGTVTINNQLRMYSTNGTFTNNGTVTVTDDLRSNNDTDDGNVVDNNSIMSVDRIRMANADFTINNSGTFTQNGNFTDITGTETITNETGGTWNSDAADHSGVNTFNCSATNNTVVFLRTNTQDVFVPSDGSYYNLTVQGSNTKTVSGALDVDNNLTIAGSATLEMNGFDLEIGGNYSNTGGTFNEGTQTVTFDGSGAQTINNTGASETFYNLIINKSAGSVAPGGSLTTLTVEDFTMQTTNSGSFTAPTTFNIDGNALIGSGNGATWTASTNTNIMGNWTNNDAAGDFDGNSGTVTFNSSTAAQTIGGSSSTDFYNLTLNNTFGTSPEFTLGAAITAENNLTMTSGNVDQSSNSITIGTAAATPGSLTHTAGHLFDGDLIRYYDAATIADGNVAGLFPIGNGEDSRFFYVTAPSVAPTTGGTVTVSYFTAIWATIVSIDDGGTTIVRRHEAFWTIATGGGMAGGTYNLQGIGSGLESITDVTDLRLMLNSGVVGTHVTGTGTVDDPEVNRSGMTLAEIGANFHIGSTDATNSPLPVDLLSFEAAHALEAVELKWSTASETNNDFFTIERSSDGNIFHEIARINGFGTTNEQQTYYHTDYNPLPGTSYYRLTQTDFDGTSETFDPVKIHLPFQSIGVYPNPVNNGQITISGLPDNHEELIIELYALSGQRFILNPQFSDQSTNVVSLPEHIGQGVYTLVISSGTTNHQIKLSIN